MDYKIELASLNDITKIHKIIVDRCKWFNQNDIKGWNIEFYPNRYNIEYFKEQLKINKLYVAKKGKLVIGTMLLKSRDIDYWNDSKSSYYIHHLATDINFKGVGRELIYFAIKKCREDKKEYLRLDCYQTSKFLNNYYKELGFTNVGSGIQGDYHYNLWEMKI